MQLRLFMLWILFASTPCFGQQQDRIIDSLEDILKLSPNADSIKVSILITRANKEVYKNPKECIKLTSSALELAKKISWKMGIARCYRQIGVAYQNLSDNSRAMEFAIAALKIAEDINNKMFTASLYNNIGMIYLNIEENKKAQINFKKFLDVTIEIKDPTQQALAMLNLGLAFFKTENLNEAQALFHQSLYLADKTGNLQIAAYDCSNMGALLNKKGQHDSAIWYYTRSIQLASDVADTSMLAQSTGGLAESNIFLKKYPQAKRFAEEALLLAEKIGSTQHIKESNEMLSDIYLATSNYKEALEKYKDFIIARDSLMNEQKKSEVIKKDLQFEQEKKEAILTAQHQSELKRQQTIRNFLLIGTGLIIVSSVLLFLSYKRRSDARQRQKEAEFNAEVTDTEMKALRAQMNPHFIFNSLNSISDYISKNNIPEADKYLSKFAKLMRMILENSEQKEVPVKDDLKALELYMDLESLRLQNKFVYEIKVDSQIDQEQTMVPPLILQPFVENSILHGFAGKEGRGKILIHLQKQDNMINCIVEDDGLGRMHSTSLQTTSRTEERRSFGMKITKARIDILNKVKNTKARVELFDISQGMRVEVKLPLSLQF